MKAETFLQIFGDIDEKYIEQADDDGSYFEDAYEGVVVRAGNSRKSFWGAVIASIACTAAAFFGVFVLLLNIGRIRFGEPPEQSEVGSSSVNGEIISTPGQSGDIEDFTAVYLTMYFNTDGKPDKFTDECLLSKSEDHIYFVNCMILENCKVKIEGTNNFPSRLLEYSTPDMNSFMSTTNEEQIGFKATMTVTDPEKPARAVLVIGSDTENLPKLSE